MSTKILAYSLWFLLGIFGAHHFYLRRYRHGFVWLCTFGGFVIGWMRDVFCLGDYITQTKSHQQSARRPQSRENKNPKPKSSWFRIIGEIVLGFWFGVTYRTALPEEYLSSKSGDSNYHHLFRLLSYFTPAFVAIGVHIVGNIGQHAMKFLPCLLCSVVTSAFISFDGDYAIYQVIFVVFVGNKYAKSWKNSEDIVEHETNSRGAGSVGNGIQEVQQSMRIANFSAPISRKKAMVLIGFCYLIYASLFFSGIWFNTYITTSDGERVRVKDAVNHFFNSPAWKQMLSTLKELYEFWRLHGTRRVYSEFLKALDPEGEANAYKVLEISERATEVEIRAKCRALSRKYHPDKEKDPNLKDEAQARFIEVQEACQILDKVRARRSSKSRSEEL